MEKTVLVLQMNCFHHHHHLHTIFYSVCQWPVCEAASSTATPELQLQQTLPHITSIESQHRADIPLVRPDVLNQTQQPQEATCI